VEYCSGDSKGTQRLSIGIAYNSKRDLVLNFDKVEDAINPEDFGRIRDYIIANLREL